MGKTKFSRQNGKVHVHGHKYENLQGTRAQVWHGTAYKTAGDLTKKNLMQNKHGRIVSRKLHDRAKREKRLEKAGYKTKKGKFGSFHVSGKTHRKGKGRGRGKKHRGGSSGIGLNLKNKLIDLSCNVIDLSRRNNHDITNYAEINNFVENNITNIDILINCAGHIEPKKILDMELNEWNKHIDVNLTSIFYLTKIFINKFNNRGVILNISSPSAKKTREEWSAYCCSKAALNNFTLNCSNELKNNNIMVNAISPTKTDTPMIERLFPDIAKKQLIHPGIISNFMISILCESFSNNLTGQIFEVTR